ncbi:hypothetical protein CN568_07300 [Bacillus pseudomycoides]|uniref:hypothetical protein n=1 Tax=Bacillus pseudomycoides TaxID=64104 RepID=UPI00031F08D2|nr:hypothetical protein [Bacillus pseudomycoides]KFN14316.1 hypothetical protein DJ94_1129 [Bacillus pseudomycoides]MDR4189682.1 hypothetical protein [Bacillus pseudomycoides]PEK33314.1 hypothetical protein CN691_15165 [Bacillus pseudomycoides]PEK69795.1 hypothetical protein CN593_07780 [Bacillus pseudomycoides]PEP44028.1 hypothetical protein CN565_06655 [Bacillus pseudomycoides]
MEQVIAEFFSPSKKYKVQIIKRKDDLYTTEVYRWMEDCGYEFRSFYWLIRSFPNRGTEILSMRRGLLLCFFKAV